MNTKEISYEEATLIWMVMAYVDMKEGLPNQEKKIKEDLMNFCSLVEKAKRNPN